MAYTFAKDEQKFFKTGMNAHFFCLLIKLFVFKIML